jgi:hypothetical protein
VKIARLAPALVLAAALSLTSATIGLAASLGLSSARLTTATKVYSAPVTCTLTASADSYVSNALFQGNNNFGTSTSLQVEEVTPKRSLLRFDLTTCSPAIPSDALVQSATLRLTVAAQTSGTRTYELRSITGSWTETGVTFNNQPTVAGSVTASTTVNGGTAAGTVVQWTSTSDVQSFVTGAATNLGWRLDDSNEGGILGGTTLQLKSREAASGRPQLVVTYVA